MQSHAIGQAPYSPSAFLFRPVMFATRLPPSVSLRVGSQVPLSTQGGGTMKRDGRLVRWEAVGKFLLKKPGALDAWLSYLERMTRLVQSSENTPQHKPSKSKAV